MFLSESKLGTTRRSVRVRSWCNGVSQTVLRTVHCSPTPPGRYVQIRNDIAGRVQAGI